jgi:hypothetical protein
MKFETTILNNNGSWYVRIPPTLAKYLGLDDEKEKEYPVPAMLQDEVSKHGKYCSMWKIPQPK